MKIRKFLVAALASMMSIVACTQTPSTTLPDGRSAKDLLPTKGQVDSVSYLLGLNFGSFIKAYDFGEDFNMAEIEKGLKDFIKAEGAQTDPDFGAQFKIDPEQMNDIFNRFLEKRSEYTSALAEAEETKFFSDNLKNDGVQQTESGLQYLIIEPGNDVHPGLQDTVVVRYTGTLTNGKVFDKTIEGGEPVEFTLERVIPGWQEGMQLLGEGGKAKLFIPSRLGYGPRAMGEIEANSILIFDVELIEVRPAGE